MSQLHSTKRFTDRVTDYVKYRPSYPPALLQKLVERCSLGPESVVADVGAGTGIFTQLLVPLVGRVYAVEPNEAMRAVNPFGISIKGTSEATTLPEQSVDLVTAAQAFHWFDRPKTKIEFQRILKSGGWVALLWNERQASGSSFLQEYDAILNRWCPDYQSMNHRNVDNQDIADFMFPNQLEVYRFDSHQDLDRDALIGRSLSSSYAPARGSEASHAFIAALEDLFGRTAEGGIVRMVYETSLFLARFNW